VVVNAIFSEAVTDLCSLFRCYALRYQRQQSVITRLLNN